MLCFKGGKDHSVVDTDYATIGGGRNATLESATYSSALGGSHVYITGYASTVVGGTRQEIIGFVQLYCRTLILSSAGWLTSFFFIRLIGTTTSTLEPTVT